MSVPITDACAVEPSKKCTCNVLAPLITWLFVRISPSLDRITPDPSPAELAEDASTDTTDGRIAAATCCTDPSGAAVFIETVGEDTAGIDPVPTGDDPRVRVAHAPPPKPATKARATVDTTINQVRPAIFLVAVTSGCGADPIKGCCGHGGSCRDAPGNPRARFGRGSPHEAACGGAMAGPGVGTGWCPAQAPRYAEPGAVHSRAELAAGAAGSGGVTSMARR